MGAGRGNPENGAAEYGRSRRCMARTSSARRPVERRHSVSTRSAGWRSARKHLAGWRSARRRAVPTRAARRSSARRRATGWRSAWTHFARMRATPTLAALMLALLSPPAIGADEAFVTVGGGSESLRRSSETSVRMRAKHIYINLCQQSYEIEAVFVFDNPGDTTTHQVGFPRFSSGDRNVEEFIDFQSWVNDEPVEALEVPAEGSAADLRETHSTGSGGNNQSRGSEGLTPRVESYYVRDVEFPAGETTTTRARYRADYGRDRLFRTVSYLYGTAAGWSGDVDTMSIRVHNNSERWIDSFRFLDAAGESSSPDRAFFNHGERDFELIETDVAPGEHATFQLYIERYPWWLGDPLSSDTSDDWIYDRVEVDEEYLRLLTLDQLRIFRNTFFARAGYDFGDGELGRYFGQFRWYDPQTGELGNLLNETEEQNVEVIGQEEQRRRTFP